MGLLSSLVGTPQKPIYKRIQKDQLTKLRLKYEPYYRVFENQRGSRVVHDGKELVMLASNDYLGLSEHPKVIEAGHRALDQWGSSTTGARVCNGSRTYHVQLEEALADFLGKEACHVHSAGYLSCTSAIQPFAGRGDVILVDKNVHSSLWSGIMLSGARYEKFSHNSPDSLSEALSFEKPETPKLLVFEGVYSMEGHRAPVDAFADIAEEHQIFSIMDDAHGFGVMGPGGRGTAHHFGAADRVDILCGSFSKALSSLGGFVAGSREAIDFLRTHSKQTLFSAALSPVQAACALAALEVLKTDPEPLERLWDNTRWYHGLLEELELDTWGSVSPAIPVVLGSKEKAYFFERALYENGVFGLITLAPAVPPGKDLIRTSISARHTEADRAVIERAFRKAAKKK